MKIRISIISAEGLELCQAQRAAAGAHLGLQQSSLLCSLEDGVLTQIVPSAPASFTSSALY